jgi:uncharacterized protein YndB with AHSA1/START domain
MSHAFEIREELTLDATPEQVWDAIATGPGIDAWFMGRSTVEPGVGGKVRQALPGGFDAESTITAWEPGKRLAYTSPEAPDGSFMAFESIIEGRAGGSTVLRFVHSGVFGNDDWEQEYDALTNGDRMYLEKLAVYVKYFTGQATTFTLFELGAPASRERAWAAYHDALGITRSVAVGDKARVSIEGLDPVDAVVEYVREPWWVGVRTDDGFYSLMWGHQDTPVIEYSAFNADVDGSRIQQVWQAWIAKNFA